LDSGDINNADAAFEKLRHCFHRPEWLMSFENKRRLILVGPGSPNH
jgi:hypothetical protein